MFRFATPFAIGLSIAAAGAHVQPVASVELNGVTVSQTVRFADLDVGSKSGATELAFRIRVAARTVCGGDNALTRAAHDFDACVDGAIDRAARRLDIAALNQALGRARTHLASR